MVEYSTIYLIPRGKYAIVDKMIKIREREEYTDKVSRILPILKS